ncbi:hypothetical protein ACNKHT_06820 [Shigella flexneri]
MKPLLRGMAQLSVQGFARGESNILLERLYIEPFAECEYRCRWR